MKKHRAAAEAYMPMLKQQQQQNAKDSLEDSTWPASSLPPSIVMATMEPRETVLAPLLPDASDLDTSLLCDLDHVQQSQPQELADGDLSHSPTSFSTGQWQLAEVTLQCQQAGLS